MCRLCNSTTLTALSARSVAPSRALSRETSRGVTAGENSLPTAAGTSGRWVLIKGGAVMVAEHIRKWRGLMLGHDMAKLSGNLELSRDYFFEKAGIQHDLFA